MILFRVLLLLPVLLFELPVFVEQLLGEFAFRLLLKGKRLLLDE